jgi:ATP adenylyltransferase
LPTPHFDLGTAECEKKKQSDPFKPPYNPNLYVGELKDEEEGTEYAVLVSGHATVVLQSLYKKKISCCG